MHKNNHTHISPCLPSPAVKQNLKYSGSILVIGSSVHLATLSVISLSGLITAREGLCSEKQEHITQQEHITTAVYPPIPTLPPPLHLHTQEEAGLKHRVEHVQQWSSMWDDGSVTYECFKAWDGLTSMQETEVVVQENFMPITSAYYQR